MCSFSCISSKTHTLQPLWNELVLGADSLTWLFLRDLIEDFWPKVVSFLSEIRSIDIAHPTDEAWFHIRRATHHGRNDIEVLRLKSGFIPVGDVEKIRLLAGSYSGINDASWQRWSPEARHDNAFLSFLLKLTILRGRYGIYYDRYLGKVTKCNYAECPYVQEAYKVMTTRKSRWSAALDPWLKYMSSTNMDDNSRYEYAHWFGHILSGWPDDIEQ